MKKAVVDIIIVAAALAMAAWNGQSFRAEYYFLRGNRDFSREKYQPALSFYEQAAGIIPGRYPYQRAAGQAGMKLFDKNSGNLRPLYLSHHAFREALDSNLHYPYAWSEVGDVLFAFEDAGVSGMPSPESYYEKALSIDPINPRFLFNLLKWRVARGRSGDSMDLFVRLAFAYPPSIKIFGPAMLKDLQDREEFGKHLDDSLKVNIEYASYLLRIKQYEQALAQLKRISPQNRTSPKVPLLEADILDAVKKPGEGRAVLLEANKRWPGDIHLAKRLAIILEKDGDLGAAIEVYQRALKVNSRFEFDVLLARLAAKNGRQDLAMEHYKKALSTGKTNDIINQEIYLFMAGNKEEAGNFLGALADYEKARAISPSDQKIEFSIKKVKYLMEMEKYKKKSR